MARNTQGVLPTLCLLENPEMPERMGVIFRPISSIILADAHFSGRQSSQAVFTVKIAHKRGIHSNYGKRLPSAACRL